MKENDTFDDLDDLLDEHVDGNHKAQRPNSLLALCILTLVGSGLILLKDVFTFEFYGAEGNLGVIYFMEVFGCLGTIAGAILMILMKRSGFYIYLGSTVLYMISIVWFWYEIMGVLENEWTIAILIFYLAAPIGFIILYSSHKNYLH